MSDLLEVIRRLGTMTDEVAERLRTQIAEAQSVLDKLDAFTRDTDDVGQLAAASDLFPNWFANIPDRAGLTRADAS